MNNFKDKLSNFFFLNGEERKSEDIAHTKKINDPQGDTQKKSTPNEKKTTSNVPNPSRRKSGGENVVAINQKKAVQKPQITIVEPRLYSEVQEIADYLLANQSVILNFRRMDHKDATKMIDFLMGTTYAVKGDIQRLDEELFICTPQSVAVNGSDLSEYTDSLL